MKILIFTLLSSILFVASCKSEKENVVKTATSKVACFKVEGMTCATCSTTIKVSVKKLKGIISVNAFSDDGSAVVSFDSAVVDAKAIKSNIDSVGYKATERACQKSEG